MRKLRMYDCRRQRKETLTSSYRNNESADKRAKLQERYRLIYEQDDKGSVGSHDCQPGRGVRVRHGPGGGVSRSRAVRYLSRRHNSFWLIFDFQDVRKGDRKSVV